MGGPLLKQAQQDSRRSSFTLPAGAVQGYQGRSPWLVRPRPGPGYMRPASNRFHLVVLALVLASPVGPFSVNAAESGGCMPVGVWVYPGRSEQPDDVLGALARRGVVLLGESHDEAEHHRWQLHTIAALLSRQPDMVLGFEMFPRRVQAVLDRWSKGELNEAEFLREVNWTEIWGTGAEFYLPLFHFARMHRLSVLALNVDRTISRRIAAQGLAAIPNGEREGVGNPAPASSAYRDHRFETFKKHPSGDEAIVSLATDPINTASGIGFVLAEVFFASNFHRLSSIVNLARLAMRGSAFGGAVRRPREAEDAAGPMGQRTDACRPPSWRAMMQA